MESHPPRSSRRRWLVGGVVVVVIVALGFAGLVVRPRMISQRLNTNESAARAMLKQLASAQARIAAAGVIDRDGDGAGEFADFRQLHDHELLLAWGNGDRRSDTRVEIGGYLFEIHLPADPSDREQYWACYAWPVILDTTGKRAFFINQGGDGLGARNSHARYSGPLRAPMPGTAAFLEAGIGLRGTIAANTVGADRELWVLF